MNRSEKFWDKQAARFDREDNDSASTENKTAGKLRKHLKPSDKVLEYACGTGRLAIDVAPNVGEVQGIDISSEMIAIAKGNAVERNAENVNFSKTTIFEARFPEDSFDVILAFYILHLVETQQVLRRVYDLLKPGGLFISETPCLGETKSVVSFVISLASKVGLVPKIQKLGTAELEDLLVNIGFEIVEAEANSDMIPIDYIVARKN
ncbi:MAG: class I SAM-dependent methyltransferase [Chloroflexi bacterium]|nr:class I SAM-dependent methyltransferase [Chloroflexota bacterium]